jgi:hypothetical protein
LGVTSADEGTLVAAVSAADVDIVMTMDSDTGLRSATCTRTAGWCLATVAVYR